jgi:hypothetical protein
MGLKLNSIDQLLVCADVVGDNIVAIRKTQELELMLLMELV